MSILILNYVPHRRCPYEQFLRHLGEDLILLTAEDYETEFDPKDYVYFESFPNYRHNNNVELRAMELYERYRYHTIIANAEADIIRAAKLRERFQLQGQNLTSAIQYRDKAMMKHFAQKNGIPTPAFAPIENAFDLIDFISKNGFPVVMKPADGVGSRDTYVLHQETDLKQLLSEGVPSRYLAEGFVEGEVCHVDGIVKDGKIAFICASKYLTEPLSYQNRGYLGSYVLPPTDSLAQRLTTMTEKLIYVLETPENTTFHAEWFHTPDDQIVLCEIASRTGGGKIVESLYHAYDIHLDQAFVQTQCQLPLTFSQPKEQITPVRLTGWVKIPPHAAVFNANPEEPLPAWVIAHEYRGVPGKRYDDPNGVREYIASFIVEGDSTTDVYHKLLQIADWYHENSSWMEWMEQIS